MHLLSPLTRAIGQLDDRAFLGVLLRCLAWSAACLLALHFAAIWVVERVLHWHGLLGWTAGILASVGASILAGWLFLPLAAVIATMYIARIAAAVERLRARADAAPAPLPPESAEPAGRSSEAAGRPAHKHSMSLIGRVRNRRKQRREA